MTAHEYAQNLASKGMPLNAISRATGLSVQDITYLRPKERKSCHTPKPQTVDEVMPLHGSKKAKEVFMQSCKRLNIDPSIVLGPKRTRKYAWPRQEIMFDIFVLCPRMSYPAIAYMMKRDHTTIIHGVRKHCERIGMSYSDAIVMRVMGEGGNLTKHINSDVFEAAMGRYGRTMRLAAGGRV